MFFTPSCLTNTNLAIGAIGIFTFYSFALIYTGSWLINKNKKTGLRALGLLILTLGSILYAKDFNSLAGQISAYAVLLGGAVLLTLSYILFRRAPRQSKNLVDPPRQSPKSIDTSKQQAIEKSDLSIKKSLLNPSEKPADKATPQQRPATAKHTRAIIKTVAASQRPDTNVGLRSNAFLKLPKRRKKGITSFLNTAVGFIIFVLIGWGAYIGYQKLFGSKDVQPDVFEESSFVEQHVNTSPVPETESSLTDTELTTEEDETAYEETAEASPTPKPITLNIKETEIGYLNVRDGAGTIFEIITTISPGDTVEMIDENKAWYKIKIDDNTTGWISSRYADKNTDNPDEE